MIIRLRNPEALALQPIRDLFARAFESQTPVSFEVFMPAIEPYLSSPDVAVLVGREDNAYKAVTIALMPGSALFPFPQVYHFYNEGSAKLRNRLIDALVEWVKEQGYNSLHVAKWSDGPDKVWKRAFSRAGRFEKLGSTFRIDF